MARLIPAFMDDHTPPGERDVFNMFTQGPDNWVILHSLDLAPWNRRLRTEIDFVAIIPDCGILCMEVKSHMSITFDGSFWSPPEIKRSPFKQASDGRYTFYRNLRELAPQYSSVPVVHLCIFPNASFSLPTNLSVQRWELMDAIAFRSFRNAADFCQDLKRRILLSIDEDSNLKRLVTPLSNITVQAIVDYCVPVQKRHPDAREEIRHREQEIENILRDQQKPVFQLVENNERVIVSGGAGTGKSLIAMELARRRAESGERVALLCFNQLFGVLTKEKMIQIKPDLPNLVVGTVIQVMAELMDIVIPDTPDRNFWDKVLPVQLEEKLTDPELHAVASFDYLILDEAQDILARPVLWECLIQFLAGGLKYGNFALLGDFEHQVLGERDLMMQSLDSVHMEAQPAKWKLTENCRNYSIVGDTAVMLSGFEKRIYSGYMRRGGGVKNYDINFYATDEEQCQQLADALKDFGCQGYRPEEITVLSFSSSETCAAQRLIVKGHRLYPAWQQGRFIHYSTVHSFKGLENKVIILTDVSFGEAEFQRDLFYTGMTRATESVRVLCNSKCQKTLFGWLTKKGAIHDRKG